MVRALEKASCNNPFLGLHVLALLFSLCIKFQSESHFRPSDGPSSAFYVHTMIRVCERETGSNCLVGRRPRAETCRRGRERELGRFVSAPFLPPSRPRCIPGLFSATTAAAATQRAYHATLDAACAAPFSQERLTRSLVCKTNSGRGRCRISARSHAHQNEAAQKEGARGPGPTN